MSALPFLTKKIIYQVDRLWGTLQYPLKKTELIERLAASIPAINIETTNICNANCTFCAYQYQERPTGVMSLELFRKIIDEYVELGGGSLGLTPTVGDPLLDKHLIERIAYARRSKAIPRVGMYTNMIALDRVGAAALLNSGVSSITVSISGFDEAMYRRVYRSAMYKQVVRNIRTFATLNNEAGRPVDFTVDMRVDRPINEVTAYPDYLEIANLIGKERMGVKFRYDDWSGAITPDQLTGTMKIRTMMPLRISPCSELYSGPMVYWDGRVGACGCRDINASELIIGNVATAHLGDIWFGEELRKLRDEFMTPRIKPICSSCKHYNNLSLLLARGAKDYLVNVKPASYTRKSASCEADC
jgi:MoaA/NifB/PqqE/SkfB family radical SAM enzyme